MLYSLPARWIAVLTWAALIGFLMLTPGEDSIAEDISVFFGGTDLSDLIGHVIVFGILALLLFALLRAYHTPRPALILSLILAVAYGTLTEMLQMLVPHRGANLMDMVGNWLGPTLIILILRPRNLSQQH
jgi:hypothetical protein